MFLDQNFTSVKPPGNSSGMGVEDVLLEIVLPIVGITVMTIAAFLLRLWHRRRTRAKQDHQFSGTTLYEWYTPACWEICAEEFQAAHAYLGTE